MTFFFLESTFIAFRKYIKKSICITNIAEKGNEAFGKTDDQYHIRLNH